MSAPSSTKDVVYKYVSSLDTPPKKSPPKNSKKTHRRGAPQEHRINPGSRTTSREENITEEKTDKAAKDQFKKHRNSVDITVLRSKEEPSAIADNDTVDSSVSSNPTSETTEKSTSAGVKKLIREVTPMDQMKEECHKAYCAAALIHDQLINKIMQRVPFTDDEAATFQEEMLQIFFTLHQMHFTLNIPQDRFDYSTSFVDFGEGVNFFSPKMRSEHRDYDYGPLNRLLNEQIGVIPVQKHTKRNAKILAKFTYTKKKEIDAYVETWNAIEYSTAPTANKIKEYEANLKIIQDQYGALRAFERRVRLLCRHLRGKTDTLKNPRLLSYSDAIRKLCEGKEDYLLGEVADSIQWHYQPHFLQPLLEAKGREIFECYQFYNPKSPILKKQAAAKWFSAFKSAEMPNQLIEWLRAIVGPKEERGIVYFLDANGNIVLPPFEKPEGGDFDKLLNKYVLDCQRVVGHHLFNDGPLMQKLCALIKEEANLVIPPKPNETELEAQKRIMDYFAGLQKNPPRLQVFFVKLVQNLNAWNRTREDISRPEIGFELVQEMLSRLMLFYQIPYQLFVNGPTLHLRKAFELMNPGVDVKQFCKDSNASVCEAKRIDIKFTSHSLDVVYHTPSLICAAGTDATYTLIQKMTLKTFLGQGNLEDPLTVEYQYEVPEGISKHNRTLLDKSRDALNRAAVAIGYEPMKLRVDN